MPIYEYACAACGHEFEEWQKMADAPVRTCPKCKKKKVERLISRTAFQLKGGGWYADLYSSSKPGGADKGEGKSDSKSEGGKDGGKDGGTGSSEASSSDSSSSKAAGAAKDSSGAASTSAKDTKKKGAAKKSESRAA